MSKRFLGSVAILAAAFMVMAGYLVGAGSITAQGTDATPGAAMDATAPHPAHIHLGTCDELGDVVFPLNDVVALGVTGSPEAGVEATPVDASDAAAGQVVARSTTVVEASLDDIVSGGHAINVHESAENVQNYIACGDIVGTVAENRLQIELGELNESGFMGEALLTDNGDVTTTVTITLMQDAAGTPVATPAAGSGQGDEAGTVTVEIKDFAYGPETVTIPAGGTVTWTNQDAAPHTATAQDREVLQSGALAQGESYSQTFDTPGTYEYFCEFHAGMKGTVIVE